MRYSFEFVTDPPDLPAFQALMQEFFETMLAKLVAVGGPQLSAPELAAGTVANLDAMRPPKGRLLLATRDDGRLIGCGVLRQIRPDAAELKRMYIRPEARGHGLGRQLFERRIEEARRMGCKTLYADTIKGNTAMLSMYERFGFTYMPRYPENANGPELAPYLVYLEHHLV